MQGIKNACIFLYNMFKYDHTDKVKNIKMKKFKR